MKQRNVPSGCQAAGKCFEVVPRVLGPVQTA